MDEVSIREAAAHVAGSESGSAAAWSAMREIAEAVEQAGSDLGSISSAELYGLVPQGTADRIGTEIAETLSIPASRMKALIRETQRILAASGAPRAPEELRR